MNEVEHSFIIVCADKRLSDHTATLKALLEQHGHEVDRWTDKQFKAVKASIAQDYQDDKFVILGSDALAEVPKCWAYQRFGGYIGWQGNFCVITAKNTVLNTKEYEEFLEYCAAKKETWQDVIIPPKSGLEQMKGWFGDRKTLYILLVHEFFESLLEAFLAADPALDEPADAAEDRKADAELKIHLEHIQQGFERLGKKIADRLPKIPKPQRKLSEEQDASSKVEDDEE